MRTRTLLAALVALVVAAPLAVASGPAAPVAIVAGPGAWVSTYATPAAVVPADGALTFHNGDLMRHNVVSHAFGPDDQPWCLRYPGGRCPLVWSPLVGLGGSTPVSGLENAEPLRAYTFYCTLHPNMEGALVVLPEGA